MRINRFTALTAVVALGLAACNNDTATDEVVDGPAGPVTSEANASGGAAYGAIGNDRHPGRADPMNGSAGAGDRIPGDPMVVPELDTPPGRLRLSGDAMTGSYLSDGYGRAVYYLGNDADGSRCVGECLRLWPPVLADDDMPEVTGQLRPGLVGMIERADGTRQLTYNDRPLYYFARDSAAPTDTVTVATGHGLSGNGGEWYLLTAEGTEFQQPGETGDATRAATAEEIASGTGGGMDDQPGDQTGDQAGDQAGETGDRAGDRDDDS